MANINAPLLFITLSLAFFISFSSIIKAEVKNPESNQSREVDSEYEENTIDRPTTFDQVPTGLEAASKAKQNITNKNPKDLLGQDTLPIKPAYPGIVYSFDRILQLEKKQWEKIEKEIPKKSITTKELESATSVNLNPAFLARLILHSEKRYLYLAKQNECAFWALLENKLFNYKGNNLIVDIVNPSKASTNSTTVTAMVGAEDFFKYLYSKKCFKNREVEALFNVNKIPELLKNIDFAIPHQEKECQEIFRNWVNSPYTPYICKLATLFPDFPKMQEQFTQLQHNYINNLCLNLDSATKFCAPYLDSSYWTKILNGEREQDALYYRCIDILKKSEINKQDYRSCIQRMEEKDDLCNYAGAILFPSLSPRPNCQSISLALSSGRLVNRQEDCPAFASHEGVINSNRIFMNFFPQISFESNRENCASNAWGSFFKIVTSTNSDKIWNYNLCYFNKVQDKEACFPVFPEGKGESNWPNSELLTHAESKVIAKILIQSLGAPEDLVCHLVDQKHYLPVLLKFKRGCYLVYDENCQGINCKKEIIYNEQKIKNIKTKTGVLANYFPTSIREDSYSISYMLKTFTDLTEVPIKNASELNFFLSQNKKTIIHGTGCREDLLPSFFIKKAMNQCTLLAFIIDGYFEKDATKYIVIRTAIDDVHSPRIISWNELYNSIRNYQELHPLKSWTLYALKPKK